MDMCECLCVCMHKCVCVKEGTEARTCVGVDGKS